jgi:hypothetical protein
MLGELSSVLNWPESRDEVLARFAVWREEQQAQESVAHAASINTAHGKEALC